MHFAVVSALRESACAFFSCTNYQVFVGWKLFSDVGLPSTRTPDAGASESGPVSTRGSLGTHNSFDVNGEQVLSEDSTQLKLGRLATRTAIARAP